MRNAIFVLFLFFVNCAYCQDSLITTLGEFRSVKQKGTLTVKKINDGVFIKYELVHSLGSKTEFTVKYSDKVKWFVYLDDDDKVWVYGGGEVILRKKMIVLPDGGFQFDDVFVDVQKERSFMPAPVRGFFEQLNK